MFNRPKLKKISKSSEVNSKDKEMKPKKIYWSFPKNRRKRIGTR